MGKAKRSRKIRSNNKKVRRATKILEALHAHSIAMLTFGCASTVAAVRTSKIMSDDDICDDCKRKLVKKEIGGLIGHGKEIVRLEPVVMDKADPGEVPIISIDQNLPDISKLVDTLKELR